MDDIKMALLGDHEAAKLTHLSLFSGIGGLDLAAEMAGFRTVGQCEWADYPTKVLEKHWPDVPRWRDIRTLTGESFYEKTGMRTVSIISGGFPCQPHSVIGKRLAENDERHLWPEFIRVVRELRPKYVVGENVNGILSTIHESVCSDLEKEGYEVWTFSIPACAVGAHHERYRVCILGISKSKPGFQADTQTNATGTQRKTRTNNVLQPWDYLPGTYWAVHQPPVCGMDDGIPDWMGGYSQYKERMQCYGNAVVPQQFYPIFQAIADIERELYMDDVKLAMLGSKEAAKRLTDAGVLVPCPFCRGEVSIVNYDPRLYRPSRNHTYAIVCSECDIMFGWDIDYGGRFDTEEEARLAWNTRAPILSSREMEMLEGLE